MDIGRINNGEGFMPMKTSDGVRNLRSSSLPSRSNEDCLTLNVMQSSTQGHCIGTSSNSGSNSLHVLRTPTQTLDRPTVPWVVSCYKMMTHVIFFGEPLHYCCRNLCTSLQCEPRLTAEVGYPLRHLVSSHSTIGQRARIYQSVSAQVILY